MPRCLRPNSKAFFIKTLPLGSVSLIDVEAEVDKLARECKALEQDLQWVHGKMGNENFLRNAPPDVVVTLWQLSKSSSSLMIFGCSTFP